MGGRWEGVDGEGRVLELVHHEVRFQVASRQIPTGLIFSPCQQRPDWPAVHHHILGRARQRHRSRPSSCRLLSSLLSPIAPTRAHAPSQWPPSCAPPSSARPLPPPTACCRRWCAPTSPARSPSGSRHSTSPPPAPPSTPASASRSCPRCPSRLKVIFLHLPQWPNLTLKSQAQQTTPSLSQTLTTPTAATTGALRGA